VVNLLATKFIDGAQYFYYHSPALATSLLIFSGFRLTLKKRRWFPEPATAPHGLVLLAGAEFDNDRLIGGIQCLPVTKPS
jgi:hypothetical protein